MYIIKNALRCIGRSVGRNVLIGIIVLVIAVSSCIGLSIRQASVNARKETLEGLSITASLSYDRQALMQDFGGMNRGENGQPPEKNNGEFDRDSFKDMMGEMESLSLEEYETYASASTVKDFYYTLTAYLNGTDDFQAVSNSLSDTENTTQTENQNAGFPMGQGGMGKMGGGMAMNTGDFTLIGYSSDTAMTDFANGSAAIVEGAVFAEGTSDFDCIISEELATYNELCVGDEITLVNPFKEDEEYNLNVVGVYEKASEAGDMSSQFGFTMSDPANEIYLSYNALQSIADSSLGVSNEDNTSALRSSLNATYTFADVDAYEAFCEEVYTLGLDDNYTVSSSDISAFEQSLIPLETLSTMAFYFLLVILIIGAVILVVLNIFNIRERKYEIGVLTAMGMKKGKVALQFVTEIFLVTICAVILGIVIGGVSAVPVTNALLENQTTAQSQQSNRIAENFGRENSMGEMMAPPNMDNSGKQQVPQGGFMNRMPDMQSMTEYVTQINSAMNLTVVFQMLLIAVCLTLVSGAVSMLFVMRYEPLRILSNRD
ncbi:MAG: ABC transporter permease [Ruminococcus sp.]|nr:ABC transporter permease [Ruminococcus sp.]